MVRFAALLVVAGLTISYAHRSGDFAGYLLVGELGLTGQDVYRDAPRNINTWPPLFSLFCIPLAAMARVSLVGARTVWLLLNWAALGLALVTVVKLCHGRPPAMARSPASSGDGIYLGSSAVLLPLLLSSSWILSNFEHLQVNVLVFALTLTGLLFHHRGRDARAGLLIGAAAALKVAPVLFAPYFFWRRQWRAGLFTIVSTAGWSILPAAVYGWKVYLGQLMAWREALQAGWSVGKMNQSVYAMFDRLLGHGLVPFTVAGADGLPATGSSYVAFASGGLLAVVTLLGLWLFRGPYEPRGRAVLAEWSTVFLVSVLFGKVTWKAYLVVLLLPMTLFVETWRERTIEPAFRRKLRTLTWLAFALGSATAADLTGRRLASRLEMGSVLTLMALLIMSTLFWYRSRISSARGD